MLNRFREHIEKLKLFSSSDTILVGVSGGTDSVVLLDLLDKAGLSVAMAHCNFNLRGEESLRDENFVKSLARQYDKPFHLASFDTRQFAVERGISIEMAARELRYHWFEELCEKNHYDWVAVAHHRDDQLETFFLNLSRGTGIQGLTGMKAVYGRIVRPLLFASRKEIEQYRFANHLEYIEDSSNIDLNILRNRIRHQLLPAMEEINPSFRESLSKTMYILQEVDDLFQQQIEYTRERISLSRHGDIYLSKDELKLLCPLNTYLFELLRPYHFNSDVVADIERHLDGIPGKKFLSADYQLEIDRDYLIIRKIIHHDQHHYYIDEGVQLVEKPVHLKISVIENNDHFRLERSPKVALIDRDKVKFPLMLRRWQSGDYFRPLGMSGMKKVSDYFIDEKFSLAEKERSWLLTNGEQIVWIVGARLDDRYKIVDKTKKILRIELCCANC